MIYIYYIIFFFYLIYNSVGVKKKQIVQFANSTNWYPGKIFIKKKRQKTHILHEDNQAPQMSTQKKKYKSNYKI